MAAQSLALLLVIALLASALGPMLDHHFAERHPGHGHLYLGAVSPGHSHPFQHSHIHYDAMYAPSPAKTAGGDVVFFAPNDGMGHAPADLTAPAVMPTLRFDGGEAPLLRNGADGGAVLRGITVPPPRRPPKA